MKKILFATTALVATAGFASADVTFSGKGEAGIYRTAKSAAVKAVAGVQAVAAVDDADNAAGTVSVSTANVAGVAIVSGAEIKATKATGTANASNATSLAAAKTLVLNAQAAVAAAEIALRDGTALATSVAIAGATAITAGGAAADIQARQSVLATAQANLYAAEIALALETGTAAKAEGKAGDMVAYSGYDMDVAISTETDSGLKFTMGFDMGAGHIADQDDDRVMDAQSATIEASTFTLEANGYTLVIGQDEIDDLYDDSQNGDMSLSGDLGGLAFTVVHDLEDSVLAKNAVYTAESGTTAATFTDAVAKDHNGSSLKLDYTMGAATLGLVATSADDDNNSANKVTLGYTVSDTLSFSVAQDSKGKAAAITSASVTYAIDALTVKVAYADDKNHAGNTNKNKKASTNLDVTYSQGPISATFATDESSAWWINTKYDLGGGATAFATVDHQDFAVAGLSFAF